ncbi:MAG: DUF1326 domain-containing protein [Anaerolineae bacterium]
MANYEVEGSLLEACSCGAPCPCWIGEDPDHGTCDSFLAYRINKGSIRGVDVGGVAFALVAHIPGNVLKGNWKVAVYMSDKATPGQKQAVLDAWTGKFGGPLADLAQLVGEVCGVHDAPVDFRLEKGKGTLKVGQAVDAELVPYTDAKGNTTTISNTIFSTIPGSPAYVAKATRHKVNIPEHGMQWTFENRNAIQGDFRFAA